MSKSDTWEAGLMLLAFNNTAFAGLGDTNGLQPSASAGSLYVSLHTADPGETGTQQTNEAAYTGYTRVAVARSSGGWTCSTNQASNTAAVTFPQSTSGPETELYFGVGTASSGAGKLLYSAPLGSLLGPFTALATDTITIPGLSGLSVGDRIAFFGTFGGSVPTGLTEGTVYFVKTLSGNDITVSTTSGGSTVDITAAGAGVAMKCTPLVVNALITPSFAAGALVVKED